MQNFYIGTSGWGYDHWKRRFYPKDLKKKDWLDYYSTHFKTVEVNMSFYRLPSEKHIKRWKAKVTTDFKFTLKANRLITHWKKIDQVEEAIERFYKLTTELGRKAGCHLFQLPPSFTKTSENLTKIKKLLELLDARRDNVIEFRDQSWWNKGIYSLLDRFGIGFCTVSGLDMPSTVIVTGSIGYFRFHGKDYTTKYSSERITSWSNKIEEIDCNKAYIYFNNDNKGYAVENAKQMLEELQ